MSWLSKLTGRDHAREGLQKMQAWSAGMAAKDPTSPENLHGRYAAALDDAGKGTGWEDAFKRTAGAVMTNALPGLRNDLQMTRENAIRRGVSTGDYGTSAEGDVTSAWQRNIANALAGQSMVGYEDSQNRYLDLLTGQMDRNTGEENAKKKNKSGLLGGIGAAAGFFLSGGNPAGAAAGQAIGSGVGGYF